MLKPTNRIRNPGRGPERLDRATGLARDIYGRRLDDCAIGMSNFCGRGHRSGEMKGGWAGRWRQVCACCLVLLLGLLLTPDCRTWTRVRARRGDCRCMLTRVSARAAGGCIRGCYLYARSVAVLRIRPPAGARHACTRMHARTPVWREPHT